MTYLLPDPGASGTEERRLAPRRLGGLLDATSTGAGMAETNGALAADRIQLEMRAGHLRCERIQLEIVGELM